MVPFAYSLAPPHWINQLRKIGFKHRCLLWWCIVLSSWYSKGGLQWVDMISKNCFLFLVFMNLLFCWLKIISKKYCLIWKLWSISFGWNTHNCLTSKLFSISCYICPFSKLRSTMNHGLRTPNEDISQSSGKCLGQI